MRPSARRSGFAWIALLSLLGAATVAPVVEVGDLLEASLLHPRLAPLGSGPPCHAEGCVASRTLSPTRDEEFFAVGQYVALRADAAPGPGLEPLARLFVNRPAPLSLSHAGRLHTDRGPPQAS